MVLEVSCLVELTESDPVLCFQCVPGAIGELGSEDELEVPGEWRGLASLQVLLCEFFVTFTRRDRRHGDVRPSDRGNKFHEFGEITFGRSKLRIRNVIQLQDLFEREPNQ